MARLERKAYYVGTWREDVVTDTIMRQIIARSHAEKGQKVKVKLSKAGIGLSRTVVFQESYMYSFPLNDIYFLTVNQRHPTCLLCIAADPVRKYLILALRTLNEVEAQEIISTFHALKENPSNNTGNVVLRRKDNGNWTLRDRSQHNANRHMQEIFKETTPTSNLVHQSNGHTRTYVLDASKTNKPASSEQQEDSKRGHFGSQTMMVGSETKVAKLHSEVEHLSQELQDIKFVLEKAGTVSASTINYNHPHSNNSIDKPHYVLNEVHAMKGAPQLINGALVSAYSEGGGSRPGEARVSVEDHRESRPGMVRAQSAGSVLPDRPALVISNGRVQRQITVPEPMHVPSTVDHPDSIVATTSNGYTEIPAYTVQRRISTEYVQIAGGVSRKPSNAESTRSSLRVKFDPEAVRRSQARHHQFRSVRASRSGVPTTIVRPIEQIYAPPNGGVVVLHKPPSSILKRKPVPSEHPLSPSPSLSSPAVYVPQPTSSTVYVTQPPSNMHHPNHRRRSRPNSVHVMDGNDLKIFQGTGELDDVLL